MQHHATKPFATSNRNSTWFYTGTFVSWFWKQGMYLCNQEGYMTMYNQILIYLSHGHENYELSKE